MESYSYKKRVGGRGCSDISLSNFQAPTSYFRFSLTPLDPTLTSKWPAKSFSFNTYKKQGEGGGGGPGPGARQEQRSEPLATDAPRPYSFPVTKPCASSRSIVRVRPYRALR